MDLYVYTVFKTRSIGHCMLNRIHLYLLNIFISFLLFSLIFLFYFLQVKKNGKNRFFYPSVPVFDLINDSQK
jgi:hypothetical protein